MDTDEFTEWWTIVRPELVKLLRHYTTPLGYDVAGDLEQDVAFIAWKSRSRFSNFEHFRYWVKQCARWRAIDELRANKIVRKVFLEKDEGKEIGTKGKQEESVALHEVLEAVTQLPPQQQKVMRGFLKGKDERQLAAELNVDPNTVRSLKRFGKAKLISILGTKGGNI